MLQWSTEGRPCYVRRVVIELRVREQPGIHSPRVSKPCSCVWPQRCCDHRTSHQLLPGLETYKLQLPGRTRVVSFPFLFLTRKHV
jgi:hypothetical protein